MKNIAPTVSNTCSQSLATWKTSPRRAYIPALSSRAYPTRILVCARRVKFPPPVLRVAEGTLPREDHFRYETIDLLLPLAAGPAAHHEVQILSVKFALGFRVFYRYLAAAAAGWVSSRQDTIDLWVPDHTRSSRSHPIDL